MVVLFNHSLPRDALHIIWRKRVPVRDLRCHPRTCSDVLEVQWRRICATNNTGGACAAPRCSACVRALAPGVCCI